MVEAAKTYENCCIRHPQALQRAVFGRARFLANAMLVYSTAHEAGTNTRDDNILILLLAVV
jgi:hypothetical protein